MKLRLLLAIAIMVSLASCDLINKRSVNGNGKQSDETRTVTSTQKIKLKGSLDVDIIQGTGSSVKVIADENLLQYIKTKNEDGWLVIEVDDEYTLKSDNHIKVEVTTATLENLNVAGNGNVVGKGKFTGSDKLGISLAGNSDITLEVNAPSVDINIAGSGDIELTGETKSLDVDIAGSGNFKGEKLMAENANISIAGSGDVHVFADAKLDVKVMGSGNVFYKGSAEVKSNIMGSGKVEKQ